MAWDGTVVRRVFSARPLDSGDGCYVELDCGDGFYNPMKADQFLRTFRQFPCEVCSRPNKLRIAEIQLGISFDDVLEKLKPLARESGQFSCDKS